MTTTDLNGYSKGDVGIALTFNLSTIAVGSSDQLQYLSSLDPDVAGSLDDVLGADAVRTPEGTIELDLGENQADSIVVTVDGAPLTEGTHYTVDLTNPSKPAITFKAEAGLTHESEIIVTVTYIGETGSGHEIEIENMIEKPSAYTVTFVGWDGTELQSSSVTAGSAAVAPTAPAREGYTFTGWDKAFDNVTSDLTVTAQYAINVYTVTFDTKDGSSIAPVSVTAGGTVAKPATPTKYNHTFGGWYADEKCTTVWDFDTAILADTTIYAKWYDDGEVSIHECHICGGCKVEDCTIGCAEKCLLLSMNFTDVDEDAYYAEAVEYVYHRGMMQGKTATRFNVSGSVTRGQIVTILWRLEGSPAVTGGESFSDVASGKYYAEAVQWAAANGITGGYIDGTFRPDQAISRQQLATFLFRYAQHKGYDVSVGEDTNILSYEDVASVGEYAIPAMQWACGAGLIQGSNGNLLPGNTATRAQAAAILMRFCVNVAKI